MLVPHPHVRADPEVLGGSPHVEGSRVPVRRLWAFYRSGTPVEKLGKHFPQLSQAQIFDALAFAYDNPEVIDADIASEQELLRKTKAKAQRSVPVEQIALPFGTEAAESVRSKRKR